MVAKKSETQKQTKKAVTKKVKKSPPKPVKKVASKPAKKAPPKTVDKATKGKPEKSKADHKKAPVQVPLVGLEEVASMLRIPPIQVRKLVQSGKIPAVKLEGQWRFNKDLVYAAFHRRARGK